MVGGVILIDVDDGIEHELRARIDLPVLACSGVDEWVARASVAVTEAARVGGISSPLVVVAQGASWALLPSFAVAQRTSGRLIVAYVIIEPRQPLRGQPDWPDAPVTVVTEDGDTERIASLRGWRVTSLRPVDAVVDVIALI